MAEFARQDSRATRAAPGARIVSGPFDVEVLERFLSAGAFKQDFDPLFRVLERRLAVARELARCARLRGPRPRPR